MRSKTIDISPYRLPQSCAERSRNLSIFPCKDARDGCQDLEITTEKSGPAIEYLVSAPRSPHTRLEATKLQDGGIGILSTDYVEPLFKTALKRRLQNE